MSVRPGDRSDLRAELSGGPFVPVLPLIDLMILLGTGSLILGFVLKAAAIATQYSPTFLGFSSMNYVVIAAICFAFALTLAARTWVKLNEPKLMALRRRASEAELRWQAEQFEVEQQEPERSELDERGDRKAASGGG